MPVSWDNTDLDTAAGEVGVVHQDTLNTDHNDINNLKQGYDYANFSQITPNPVHCWPLQENSGGTAHDLAGATDATYNGTTLGQVGVLGTTCPSLDGVDDWIDAGSNVINSDADFSITGWVRCTGTSSDNIVVDERDADFAGMFINLRSDGELWFGLDDGPDNFTLKANVNLLNDWHFITATWSESSGEAILYSDGSQIASGTASLSNTNVDDIFAIGNQSGSITDGVANVRFFEGKMADIRIYDTVLSSGEIQTLSNVANGRGELVTQSKTS